MIMIWNMSVHNLKDIAAYQLSYRIHCARIDVCAMPFPSFTSEQETDDPVICPNVQAPFPINISQKSIYLSEFLLFQDRHIEQFEVPVVAPFQRHAEIHRIIIFSILS